MNTEQAQCLLKYLGYYAGAIDGKNGTLTKVATKSFQKDFGGISVDGVIGHQTGKALKHAVSYGMPAKKADTATSGDFWDDIKYFKREEFKCKCGGKYCNGYPVEMSEKLVRIADKVRDHFGKKVVVSSGIRDKEWNRIQGGVSNSRHLYGKAMDFRVSGKSANEVLAYAQAQPEIRYAYAIDQNYIHMDIE